MTAKTYMQPAKVREAIHALYGKESGAQRAFAEAIGKHELTISRYVTGRAPVGKTEAILINLLVKYAPKIKRSNLDNLDELD